MSIRASIIGVLLGLGVASLTYYNDQVIRQTFLLGNHLPASVFGFALLLIMVLNPLLRHIGERWALGRGEIAVILALGLAVCGWPGSGLMRYFTHLMVRPGMELPVQPAWQATHVLSYLPGGSALLAEGYVADWPMLIGRLQQHEDPAIQRIRGAMPDWTITELGALSPARASTAAERRQLIRALNTVLRSDRLYDAEAFAGIDLPSDLRKALASGQARAMEPDRVVELNRALLSAVAPGAIRPPPRGEGVLLMGGQAPPQATRGLIGGDAADPSLRPSAIPWRAWWPTWRLWLGVALLLALATLCLMVIVHPLWMHRERLAYPTVRFIDEATRREPGASLPSILSSRLFWIGFGAVFAIHVLNGLHAWFPLLPNVERTLDFTGLRQIFPHAGRIIYNGDLFAPTLYFSVIGFGFFVTTRVAMSVGLSIVFWVVAGAWMLGAGLSLGGSRFAIGTEGPALRLGAYIGMTLMIVYLGRRYYWHLLRAMMGFSRPADVPSYALWAGWLLVVFTGSAAALLIRYAGLEPWLAVLGIAIVLMTFLVMARINVESGLFYAQPGFMPAAMLAGLLGVQALGPENLLVLMLLGMVVMAAPRETAAAYLLNGLALGDRLGQLTPKKTAPAIGMMLAIGLVVAAAATLTIQYSRGLSTDPWSHTLPRHLFGQASASLADLSAQNQLGEVMAAQGLSRLELASPDSTVVICVVIGLVLLLGCALARLRLAWWPIHPVLFLVWGTYPASNFAVSFLIAAVVKWAAVKVGGERAYRHLKPMMVGFIAAELLAILLWSAVGAIYHTRTGLPPSQYLILPN